MEDEQASSATTFNSYLPDDFFEDGYRAPIMQVIDENQNFNKEIKEYLLDVWDLKNAGFNYNLVAVFGTLLNALFRTNFDTMIEDFRQQTTRGLWLGLGKASSTLIMDVEGTDGRERGEDQDFERKAALFSLAISQVLLINMWESQVGLYNGANMGLLRTVFEVNLEVFLSKESNDKGKNKTLLFFIIRDHIGKTPLLHLSETIKRDLTKMWNEINKPDSLKDIPITEFFDFMFFGLPHKVLLPDEFMDQVAVLRQCFYDSEHPNYVFRPNYHKRIPADGFPLYAMNVWETILENKDLDLPTQQQLLAQFRCDEIMTSLFQELVAKFKPFKKSIEDGEIVFDLGAQFQAENKKILELFDKDASRYNQEVYKKKRAEFQDKIHEHLNLYFSNQSKNIKDKALLDFTSKLEKSLVVNSLDKNNIDFKKVSTDAMEACEKSFLDSVKSMMLEESQWSYSKEHKNLKEEMHTLLEKKKLQALDKIDKLLRKEFDERWEDMILPFFSDPNDDLWLDTLDSFQTETADIEKRYTNIIKGFEFPAPEQELRIANLHVLSFVELIKKIKEQLSDGLLLLKLKNRLEDRFRYDKNGLPRIWKPSDDIDTLFKVAKDKAIKLLPLLCKVELRGSFLETSESQESYFGDSDNEDFNLLKLVIIHSQIKAKEFESRFKKEADALYLEAKRSMITTQTKIPYWMILLVFALGWNEIIAIITSPFYFFILTIGGLITYVLYMLNLFTPLKAILEVISREVFNNGKALIDQNINNQQRPQRANIRELDEEDEIELSEMKKSKSAIDRVRYTAPITPTNSDPVDPKWSDDDMAMPGGIN